VQIEDSVKIPLLARLCAAKEGLGEVAPNCGYKCDRIQQQFNNMTI
jgi:hypothetical protein